jgi:F-type H+-transporting ATPase subunit gamma
MHITRAMELVSSSKFKKAFDTLEKGRCYFELLEETFADISAYAKNSVYFTTREGKKRAFIVIAGDRGLVGGFNNNIYKTVDSLGVGAEQCFIVPFGKKATEHYKLDERTTNFEGFSVCDNIAPTRIKELVSNMAKDFVSGKVDEIYVVYTKYVNMLSQETVYKRMLPISSENVGDTKGEMMFEPNGESVLSSAVPEYLSGIV